MKKTFFLHLLLIIFVLIITSCATTICVNSYESLYRPQKFEYPEMEFIGFKLDANNLGMSEFNRAKAIASTPALERLGKNLEKINIAIDKSDSYFGIYSLQEMEFYKSNTRYVTLVEVEKNNLICDENKISKIVFGAVGANFLVSGGILLGAGAGTSGIDGLKSVSSAYLATGVVSTIVGLPFAIAALVPSKTKVSFYGVYNIYVYDSVKKAIIRKEPVVVNVSNTFKGSYSYNETSKFFVHDYISRYINNEILAKYEYLNKWILSMK